LQIPPLESQALISPMQDYGVMQLVASFISKAALAESISMITPHKFLRTQIIANLVINALINFLIAYFAYRSRPGLPYAEIAVDVLITIAILGFLVSWIAVGVVRQEYAKGKVAVPEVLRWTFRLPKGGALRAAVITLGLMLVYGGVVDGFLYLVSPNGLSGWVYILIKTVYTGICAVLAAWLGIHSVFSDQVKGTPGGQV
jgi:hypothetical protein